MNQVTEMLRLAPGAQLDDAVARLSSLFEMMSRQNGFRSAEILRGHDDPNTLLVLHAWDDIADWQTFQASDAKVAFSAGRPAALYTFVPCGMNWRQESPGALANEGAIVRREVVRGHLDPATGAEVLSSHTFSYQDYEPDLAGASLRLTRLNAAPAALHEPDATVIADELYESVHRHAGTEIKAAAN